MRQNDHKLNDDKLQQPVFTDIAFDYLKQKHDPTSIKLTNIFKEEAMVVRKLKYSPEYDFELDGLIYDETNNILYMVESVLHLSCDE